MAFWVVLLCLSLLVLFKRLADLSLVGTRQLQDEREGLEWLRRTLPRLRAAIWDAEKRQNRNHSLVLWLQEMKDLACDAEDVIGEFEYEELRRKVGGGRFLDGGSNLSSPPPSNEALVHKITEIRQRLEDLRIGDLGGQVDQEGTLERTKQTSSLVHEAEIFGRAEQKEEIVGFLLASHDGSAPPLAIAITGFGGLGKTTLAQLVYNDTRVEEHFDVKMWVCMSADYDLVKLTKEILGSIQGSIDYSLPLSWDLENLDLYQRQLLNQLKGRRFLLVIDDFSDGNHLKWQWLRAPLIHGEKGSRVLITTRDAKVPAILQATKTVKLQGLPFRDCWMLFKKHAFVDGNSEEFPRLETIGKQIVEKFKGVPLAAITMGGLLYSIVEESEWTRILESEIWVLEPAVHGILSVLKLSYDHLPPWIKRCFAYCSLFPKNWKFDKLELVQQWMALGFVQTGGRGRMEDVGAEYFDKLISRSFFQLVDDKFVMMHDLIHDLALHISQHDHSITDMDASHEIVKDDQKLRHFSLLMTNRQPDQRDLERLFRCKSLRTLAFYFPPDISFQIPHNLFLNLETLRVLDLSCGGIQTLPDSIGNLRHLQYLDLRRNAFRSLPESLCQLYKLQTLKLGGCYDIEKLPEGTSNLINLRHLDAEPDLLAGVVGIGNLTCLQELESFPISEGHGIKIEDLKDINELRGRLRILDLHRVRSKEEATRAMLNSKRHVYRLEMNWDVDAEHRNSQLEEEVLGALVPPAHLKYLAIIGYDGVRCPSWLEQQSISNIESLWLSNCRNLQSMPFLLCLPFLKAVEIHCCPRLRVLPALPTTLKELTIDSVGLEELPEFYQPSTPASGSCDNTDPSLSILRISSCPALRSLKQGLLRHHLRNLTVLSIQYCEQLMYWPEGAGFQATLLSLQEKLLIEYCPKLMTFPAGSTLSPSLRILIISGCPGVINGHLFAQLHSLSSESTVHVESKYMNLECCFEEALQHMGTVDRLEIEEDDFGIFCESEDPHLVHLSCHLGRVWSWRCDGWVHAWQVTLRTEISGSRLTRVANSIIKFISSPPQFESAQPVYLVPPEEWWERHSPSIRKYRYVVLDDDDEQHHHSSLISSCLGENSFPWAPSLRWLAVDGIFRGVFHSFDLTSLEGLWISRCGGTRPPLTDAVLSHLTGLKELQIFDCPELSLSSLQKVVRSLPSLQHLTIGACPGLSSSSSCHTASPSPSNTATLRTLFVDDANLLGDAQFVHEQLGSLWGLHVWYTNLTSFAAMAEVGLFSLGHSLQHLSFKRCTKLRHLPSDLGSRLPSLKALSIGDCPELVCLPRRLPSLMEILVIHDCPVLEPRCEPPSQRGHGAQWHQEQTDWPKIAHIPVIVIGGVIMQGSYREFLELRSEWRGF